MKSNSPIIPFNIEGSDDPDFMREVHQALQVLNELDALEAGDNQQAIAQFNHAHAPQRAIDGLGPMVLSMDPMVHTFYRAQQFDFQSKRDLNWLAQRHPEMRVRGRETTRDQVGYRAPVQEWKAEISTTPERHVRETITY